MHQFKFLTLTVFLLFQVSVSTGQSYSSTGELLAPNPPMGWMTWNFFADKIHEDVIKEMADAMVEYGLKDAGYEYVFIDDGWQGGRDNKNNIIPDPKKFPSGIKALADYVHNKGLKLGIYSDAAQLTCAGYTASFGFEEQDTKTFASWDVDYLKYDYCNAPNDAITAQIRYKKMADALRKSGRDIALGICEWGDRKPWLWGAEVGGQLWRTTADVRDKWSSNQKIKKPSDLHGYGAGILDILDLNADLHPYSGPGYWNDMDMLIVGLYGKKGPSGDLGGTGCTDVEYRTQMSLWCMLNSVLAVTCDIRSMNETTKNILLNKDIIAINQDPLGQQAVRKTHDDQHDIYLKPLANGDYAIAILNRSNETQSLRVNLEKLGLNGKYRFFDVWEKKIVQKGKAWSGQIQSHETKVFRITREK